MSFEILSRYDSKWAHPEVLENNFWVTNMMTDPYDIAKMTADEVEGIRAGFRAPLRPIVDGMAGELLTLADLVVEEGCPEEPDAPAIKVITATPADVAADELLPAIFCITGGGLTGGGTAELGALSCLPQIMASGVRAVSVFFEYRVAPANPYPAAVNDCHAVYQWLVKNAAQLHVDVDRIIIYGGSTGGHLGLCLPFRLKRYGWCGAPMTRGLVLQVPAIDDIDLNDSFGFSYQNPETGKSECWDTHCDQVNFRIWLGDRYGAVDLSPEAAPNRATLEDIQGGFPPVWIPAEAEFEPGRDAVYEFCNLLRQANVFCDLHVWGACNHGFCGGGVGPFAERWGAVIQGAIRDAVTYDFRRPWLAE